MNFPFQVIDLTHPLSPTCPSWTGACGFEHHLVTDYSDCESPVKFRVQSINMHAGIGTHMDAPAHCIPGAKTIDQLDFDQLTTPCFVIDIHEKSHEKYQCSLEDLRTFEHQYGKITKNSFVIIYTGWSRFWNQPEKYRNGLQFPSVSIEATNFLLERDIAGLGIDTLSPDTEASRFPVHQILLSAGKYIVENIAHADKLPPVGSFSMCLPLLTKNGTEAPVRLIGLVTKS